MDLKLCFTRALNFYIRSCVRAMLSAFVRSDKHHQGVYSVLVVRHEELLLSPSTLLFKFVVLWNVLSDTRLLYYKMFYLVLDCYIRGRRKYIGLQLPAVTAVGCLNRGISFQQKQGTYLGETETWPSLSDQWALTCSCSTHHRKCNSQATHVANSHT